ncbi:MAG: hypothetical protein GXP10_06950 [Gammaproteobacteria bacterium]|nr:hypothetical protein [Gammaproteobacteria bacterium]
MGHRTTSIVLLVSSLLMLSLPAYGENASRLGLKVGLFGYIETAFATSNGLFPKWDGVLTRQVQIKRSGTPPCRPNFFTECFADQLEVLTQSILNQNKIHKLLTIHRFANQIPYLTDLRNYNQLDFWAIPDEFYARNGGDCEDYVIAKYYALRILGFNIDDLRVVVVRDTNIDIYHVVLAVNLDGNSIILDNRVRAVMLDRNVLHLKPIYSINENGWWRYAGRA